MVFVLSSFAPGIEELEEFFSDSMRRADNPKRRSCVRELLSCIVVYSQSENPRSKRSLKGC